MFCPSCRSEYRADITRCATCDVELVDSLDEAGDEAAPHVRPRDHAPDPGLVHAMAIVGFLTLDDARDARENLRAAGIVSDILIRDAEDPRAPGGEEYWIRVAPKDLRAAAGLLGEEPETDHVPEDGEILCSACREPVSEDAEECPHCGARFE